MSERQKRKWQIKHKAEDENKILDISSSLGCSYVLASLLVNRGYDDVERAECFLRKGQEILHDPFLFNDMDIAVDRILSAVRSNEKITIYGDYDVDGVTSVSILYLYLEKIGASIDTPYPSPFLHGI